MIRPMCGSSSATSTWQVAAPASSPSADKCGNGVSVATEFEEEVSNIGVLLDEDEKERLLRQYGDDRVALFVLEYRRHELAATGGTGELFRGVDDRRDVRGDVLGVEVRQHLAVDEQPVAAEDDRRFDPFTLSNRAHEVANCGHRRSVKWSSEARVRTGRSQA